MNVSDDEYKKLSKDKLIDALKELNASLSNSEKVVVSQKMEMEWLDDALKKRTRELNERVKELGCLYKISDLLDQNSLPLATVMQEIVKSIKNALQYPQIVSVKIFLNGKEFKTTQFGKGAKALNCKIVNRKKDLGFIEVSLDSAALKNIEICFLREEQELINEIARRIGIYWERVNS